MTKFDIFRFLIYIIGILPSRLGNVTMLPLSKPVRSQKEFFPKSRFDVQEPNSFSDRRFLVLDIFDVARGDGPTASIYHSLI